MFDQAIERVGFLPPQPPQRKAGESVDLAMPLVAAIGGTALGYAFGDHLPPKKLAVAGMMVWGASYALGRLLMGDPTDWFGRTNHPSNLSYGTMGLLGGLGSTWALRGFWASWRGRR